LNKPTHLRPTTLTSPVFPAEPGSSGLGLDTIVLSGVS
jgi:hypothetical protein